MGGRGNSNLQASVARTRGESGGAAGLVGIGMASGMMGVGGLQQPVAPAAPAADDPIAKLKKAKEMLDLATQADYDAVKAKALDLGKGFPCRIRWAPRDPTGRIAATRRAAFAG